MNTKQTLKLFTQAPVKCRPALQVDIACKLQNI